MRRPSPHNMLSPHTKFEQGFTLVEAVIVIAITGIIAGMIALFIRLPVQGYVDSAARAELTDAADAALRRMTRDLRLALPNSIRRASSGGNQYIEFLLTKTGGRYLAEEDSAVAGNILSFMDNSKLTFDVVGTMPLDSQTIAAGDFIVVYNLGPGFDPADAYNCTGSPVVCNRAQVASTAGNIITLSSNPFANQPAPAMTSPGRQFQVVTSPVTYACNPAAGTLTRYWGYPIIQAQPIDASAVPLDSASHALLASGVTACDFSYDNIVGSLASQRSGLVGVSLTMRTANAGGDKITMFQQVHVDNTP
jgi:MSHA biogenesis protein MshO